MSYNKSKTAQSIKIDVVNDIPITKEIYIIVLESVLKYVLYQFQQIPLQIDVLEKEVQKCHLGTPKFEQKLNTILGGNIGQDYKNDGDKSQPRILQKQKALLKKEELAKKSFQRKQQRWLIKVQNMVNSYKSMLDILKMEVRNQMVKSAVFAIGSSPMTAKYIFKIQAPWCTESQYFKNNYIDQLIPSAKRNICLALFRSFTTCKDLALLANSTTFAATKLWTLFEKADSDISSTTTTNLSSENIIARPEFRMFPSAKLIEVNLMEPKYSIPNFVVEMELTPCVGISNKKTARFTLNQEDTAARNLFYNDNDKCDGEGSFIENSDEIGVVPLHDSSIDNFNNFLAPVSSQVELKTPMRRGCLDEMIDTPIKRGCSDAMIVTPVVTKGIVTSLPFVNLSQQMADLGITPRKRRFHQPQATWYQIKNSVNGFKDVCL